jgi:antitoxin SocA-like protein
MIRFRFNADKAFQAILWMLGQTARLDLHTVLKACYFADKGHLNEFGRPVFGAAYRAMKYGPVPLEIYEMLKAEPLWLWEAEKDEIPWVVRGRGAIVAKPELPQPNLGVFSESDLRHLKAGFERARPMTFDERTRETHGPDWRRANLGMMDYADMIEGADREQRIADIRDIAGRMVI